MGINRVPIRKRGLFLGIIDSLSAGFRFVGARVELLLIPILLDLVLWLAPRFSIAPLLQSVEEQALASATAPGATPDLLALTEEMVRTLDLAADRFNMLSALANQSLLHVPSLIATLSVDSGLQSVRTVSDMGIFAIGLILLTLAGIWIGVLYLNMLARRLPLGEGSKTLTLSEFLESVFRHWLWLIVFVLGLGVALLLLSIPVFAILLIMMAISPSLASGAVVMMTGAVLALLFYMYFVVVGLVLDNLSLPSAVWRSMLLVRYNFWPTIGFIVLTFVISSGFYQVWMLLVQTVPNPAVLAIAVLGNAYIGTGLAMALLVFYRTRLLRTAEELKSSAQPGK